MEEKNIELPPTIDGNKEKSKETVVDTKAKELKPVPLSVIMNRFATKREAVAMYLGYLCMR